MVSNETRWAVFCVAGLLIFANLATFGECECCHSYLFPFQSTYKCYDMTEGTPCCGYGGCNIFCCNCDGGCRKKKGSSNDIVSILEKDLFVKMDRNGDAFVDKEEARSYLLTNVYGNHTETMGDFEEGFKKLDKLGKGKLSIADIGGGKV